jgi:hypothetical protein
VSVVVIARGSDRPEIGCMAHLPAATFDAWPTWAGPTVLRTVCGLSVIGRTFDRDGPTCALCLAVSGQHPGGSGKRWLTRQHRAGNL